MLAFCRIPWKALGLAAAALLAGTFAMTDSPARAQDEGAKPIYLADMGRCQPQAALSPELKPGCWHLIPYETTEARLKTGTMIGAASFVDSPDVTLPLNVKGWHAIYLGFWNPDYQFEGGTTVKVKLGDDPCFTRIHEPDPGITEWAGATSKKRPSRRPTSPDASCSSESCTAPSGGKAYIAYVKLVPLSARQVADVQADRARKDTRIAQPPSTALATFRTTSTGQKNISWSWSSPIAIRTWARLSGRSAMAT